MKKLLFLVIISLSVLSLQAQRLNKDGRKVVSHIDIEYFGGSYYGSLDFHYDNELDLQSFEFQQYCRPVDDTFDAIHVEMYKNGDKLFRKDYEHGKKSNNWSYEYELNDSGRIVKRMRYDYAIDGSFITRIDSDIAYDESGRLKTVSTCQYYKGRKDRTYTKLDDDIISDIRHFVIKEDGNRYYERTQVCKYGSTHNTKLSKQHVYSDYVNDTNVNFNQFFTQYCWDLIGNEIDFVTEWYNVYSNNLLIGHWSTQRMKYVYDERGNLIEFSSYNPNTNKIIERFLIKYLE